MAKIVFYDRSKWGTHGRIDVPRSGYHPQVEICGTQTSCIIEGINSKDEFSFEREHIVSLKLMFADRFPDAFFIGQSVRFFEGNNLVGEAKIIAL